MAVGKREKGEAPASSGGQGVRGERHSRASVALSLFLLALRMLASLFGGARRERKRAPRPWQFLIGRRGRAGALAPGQKGRLLQRLRDLQDTDKIAARAARFHTEESDFFADPAQVERLISRLLDENPPWLFLGRDLAGGDDAAGGADAEVLLRTHETRVTEEVELHIPDESWRDVPLGSLAQRPARHLKEVWQASLLEQVLPGEVMVDRLTRGEVMIPTRDARKQRLDFRTERRRMEFVRRRQVPVPIQTDAASGRGGQLLYVLLDYSASMRGKGAVLAMSVIFAVLRANLGQSETRYLFRRFAEADNLWPPLMEPPLQARSVREKDGLLDTILATNFNGGATHLNDAFNVAVTDIETLRREESLDATLLLVTDGRAEILESTRRRLADAAVKVHTVMVAPEPNPSLAALSESYTALAITVPDFPVEPAAKPPKPAPKPRPRRPAHSHASRI